MRDKIKKQLEYIKQVYWDHKFAYPGYTYGVDKHETNITWGEDLKEGETHEPVEFGTSMWFKGYLKGLEASYRVLLHTLPREDWGANSLFAPAPNYEEMCEIRDKAVKNGWKTEEDFTEYLTFLEGRTT